MVDLVTLAAAQLHLRLDGDEEDLAAEVADKLSDATGIVVDYLKRPDHGWTKDTVPGPVRAAILLVLGALWANREATGPSAADLDPISPAVVSLLRRTRDPAIA